MSTQTKSPFLRPELDPLPERMRNLPIDRGYPVPFFVPFVTNEAGELVPEFRAADFPKFILCVKRKLCWVCGERLGSYLCFIIGPMCGITRTTSEPPSHHECAAWSLKNCPFLSRPQMVRRDASEEYPTLTSPGYMIDRNPGVNLLWITRDYELFKDGKGGTLIHVGEPVSLTFHTEGRTATLAEIEESIRTGMPFLEAAAPTPQDKTSLQEDVTRFRRLLPQP